MRHVCVVLGRLAAVALSGGLVLGFVGACGSGCLLHWGFSAAVGLKVVVKQAVGFGRAELTHPR